MGVSNGETFDNGIFGLAILEDEAPMLVFKGALRVDDAVVRPVGNSGTGAHEVKQLTDEQVHVILALIAASEAPRAWEPIEKTMRDDWGIDNPDQATEDVRKTLE